MYERCDTIANVKEMKLMNIIKYPSLTNHYSLTQIKDREQLFNVEYIATEKIHGANISIVVDNYGNIEVTKRTLALTDEEKRVSPWVTLVNFVNDFEDQIIKWAEQAAKLIDDDRVLQVHFYGELFGNEVNTMAYDLNAQKERAIRFFNILVAFDEENGILLSPEEMRSILPERLAVPFIKKDTLINLLKESEERASAFGGDAEGQVFAPNQQITLSEAGLSTPIIKFKYEKFMEKQPVSPTRPSKIHTPAEIAVLHSIKERATLQRVENVMSHGEIQPTEQNTGAVIRAVVQDIVEEVLREQPEIEERLLRKFAGQAGRDIAKHYRTYLVKRAY